MRDRLFGPMMLRSLFLPLVLALLLPAGVAAQHSESTPAEEDPAPPASVTRAAMGVAEIRDRNTAEARGRAIADGMDAAVRQAAYAVIGAEAIGVDFARFLSILGGQADAMVESYRVLGTAHSGNTFRVLVEATVSEETLRTRLAGFGTPSPGPVAAEVPASDGDGVPRVLLLIAQQDLENISPEFWWGEGPGPDAASAEEAMAAVLESAGLSIVAHGRDVPDVAVPGAIIFQPDLNDREALAIAESLGADLVVVGKAIVYRAPISPEDGSPSFNATATARVLRVGTGEPLDSVLETVVRTGGDSGDDGREALSAAGEQAGRRLAESLSGFAAARETPAPERDEPVPVPGT
jgi:hypothetical protein